jgi:hypothetical protein
MVGAAREEKEAAAAYCSMVGAARVEKEAACCSMEGAARVEKEAACCSMEGEKGREGDSVVTTAPWYVGWVLKMLRVAGVNGISMEM